MKMLLAAFISLMLVQLYFSPLSFADPLNLQKSPWTEQATYADKSMHKLGFGLLNLSTGWDALFFEMTQTWNPLKGLAKGIGYTVTNTVGGILHTSTFFIPVDLPLPNGGIQFGESQEYAST